MIVVQLEAAGLGSPHRPHAHGPTKAMRCDRFWQSSLSASSSVLPGVPDGSIEDVIDHEMPASGVPGLAYAVVADGEITSPGARGVVRIGGDTRSPRTRSS